MKGVLFVLFSVILATGLVVRLCMSRHSCRTGEFYQIRRGESAKTAFAEKFEARLAEGYLVAPSSSSEHGSSEI